MSSCSSIMSDEMSSVGGGGSGSSSPSKKSNWVQFNEGADEIHNASSSSGVSSARGSVNSIASAQQQKQQQHTDLQQRASIDVSEVQVRKHNKN